MDFFHNKEMYNKFSFESDKNGKKIFYETSILLFPNGKVGRLRYDTGQLAAYFSNLQGFCIVKLEGVNNHKSFYLNDCEVIGKINIKKIKK